MTREEFRKEIRQFYRADDMAAYAGCTVIIGIGVFLLIHLLTRSGNPFGLEFLIAILLIACGVYGLYNLPNNYKVHEIYSRTPVHIKTALVKQYINGLNIRETIDRGNISVIIYKRNQYRSILLGVHIAEDKILFSALAYHYRVSKGTSDWGAGAAAARDFRDYLYRNLVD